MACEASGTYCSGGDFFSVNRDSHDEEVIKNRLSMKRRFDAVILDSKSICLKLI